MSKDPSKTEMSEEEVLASLTPREQLWFQLAQAHLSVLIDIRDILATINGLSVADEETDSTDD